MRRRHRQILANTYRLHHTCHCIRSESSCSDSKYKSEDCTEGETSIQSKHGAQCVRNCERTGHIAHKSVMAIYSSLPNVQTRQGALVSESQTKKDVLTICVVVKVYKKETVWSWEQQKFTKASDSYPLLHIAFPSKPIHPLMFHEWLTHEIMSPPTTGCPSHAVTSM